MRRITHNRLIINSKKGPNKHHENCRHLIARRRQSADEEKYPVTGETSPVTAESSTVKTRPLGKTAQRIIDALVDDPTLTREALANKLDIKFETVKKQIASLRSRKVLDREGSDKNVYWVVLIRK